eukprot:g8855.t1
MEEGYDNKDVSTGNSSYADCADVALDLVFSRFEDLESLNSHDWKMVAKVSNWTNLNGDLLMARHGFNPSVHSLKKYVEAFSERYCKGKQGCIEKLQLWNEKTRVEPIATIDSKDQTILFCDSAELEQYNCTPRSSSSESPALELIRTPRSLHDARKTAPKCGPMSFKKRSSGDNISVNTTLSSLASTGEAAIDRYRKRLKVSSPIDINGNMFQSPVPVPNLTSPRGKLFEEENGDEICSNESETCKNSFEHFDPENADSMMQLQLRLKYDQVRSKLRQVDAEKNNLLRLHSIEMSSKEYEMQKNDTLVQDMIKQKTVLEQRAKNLENQLEKSATLIKNSNVKHAEELEKYQKKVALYKKQAKDEKKKGIQYKQLLTSCMDD